MLFETISPINGGFVNFECDVHVGLTGVNGIVPGKLYVPGKLQVGGCLLFLIRNIVVFCKCKFQVLKYFFEKIKIFIHVMSEILM